MSGSGWEELKKCPSPSPAVLWYANVREKKTQIEKKRKLPWLLHWCRVKVTGYTEALLLTSDYVQVLYHIDSRSLYQEEHQYHNSLYEIGQFLIMKEYWTKSDTKHSVLNSVIRSTRKQIECAFGRLKIRLKIWNWDLELELGVSTFCFFGGFFHNFCENQKLGLTPMWQQLRYLSIKDVKTASTASN